MNCSITPPWRPAPTDPQDRHRAPRRRPGRAPAAGPDASPPPARTRHRPRTRPPVGRRSPHLRPTGTMSHGPCAFAWVRVLPGSASGSRRHKARPLGASLAHQYDHCSHLLGGSGSMGASGALSCTRCSRKPGSSQAFRSRPHHDTPSCHPGTTPTSRHHVPARRRTADTQDPYRITHPMRPAAHHSLDDQPADQPGPGRLAMLPLTAPECREPERPRPPGKVRVRWRRYWLESSPLRRPGRPQAAAAKTVSRNSTNVIACTLVQYRQMLPMMNSSAYTR
jgi:hypothetical protein